MVTKAFVVVLIFVLIVGVGVGYGASIPQSTDLQTQINSLKTQASLLQNQIEGLTLEADKVPGLQQQVSTLMNEKYLLQSQLATLIDNKTSNQEELNTLKSQLASKNNQITELQTQVGQLQTQLSAQNSQITDLQSRFQQLLADYQRLKGEVGVKNGSIIRNEIIPSVYGNGSVSFNDYLGEVLVIDFLAPWCNPCKAQVDVLANVSLINGVKVISINIDQQYDLPSLQSFAAEEGITWFFGHSPKSAYDFSVVAIPTILVVDKYGLIVYRGFFTSMQEFTVILSNLL